MRSSRADPCLLLAEGLFLLRNSLTGVAHGVRSAKHQMGSGRNPQRRTVRNYAAQPGRPAVTQL